MPDKKRSKTSEKTGEKTNVMRLLEQKHVAYTAHSYPHDAAPDGKGHVPDGQEIAALVGRDAEQVFKTLLAVGSSGGHYVFVVPVWAELHLKKAAKAVGEKSIAMAPLKDLTPLTGYVRGGCSPVGMKKHYPTVIDETALLQDTILCSAGRVGYQIEIAPRDLQAVAEASFADICE